VRRNSLSCRWLSLFCAAVVLFAFPGARKVAAQRGDLTLFGDLIIDESKVTGLKPLSFDVILYTQGKVLISRQSTPNNGRYRFNNLPTGVYELAIEVENNEIARLTVDMQSPLLKDVRRDIEFEWRVTKDAANPGVVSARDTYFRTSANQKLFTSARQAAEKKQYDKAAQLLHEITTVDRKDFEVWFELANVHFRQKKLGEAENEYLRAIDANPGFFPALLNLGRLELFQKQFELAIQVLGRAVNVRPDSADANYFLGEAYLQSKRGSSAVVFFNEALRLDPQGMAEVHLQLARLYNRAGMKDKAAAEYEQFLKKKPDYPEKKKLAEYIEVHKRKP
jgi:tetratricopeptide (TPR) repeat protein